MRELSVNTGDKLSVSWTSDGIRLCYNGVVSFTWGVFGPWTIKADRPPARPWEGDTPPEGPLWAVVELWTVDSVAVYDLFPTGGLSCICNVIITFLKIY